MLLPLLVAFIGGNIFRVTTFAGPIAVGGGGVWFPREINSTVLGIPLYTPRMLA